MTYLSVLGKLEQRRVRDREGGDGVLEGEVEAGARAVAVAGDADLGVALLLERGEDLADARLAVVDAVAAEPGGDVEAAAVEGVERRGVVEEVRRDDLEAVACEVICEELAWGQCACTVRGRQGRALLFTSSRPKASQR